MTVREIAAWIGGEVVGDASGEIREVAKIEEAGPGSLTFLANPKYEKYLSTTHASAVLVSKRANLAKLAGRDAVSAIRVDDPYLAFLRVLRKLNPGPEPFPTGIDPTAFVSPDARVGRGVVLGRHVVVEEGASVGDGTKILHGCVIGKRATIGKDCRIYSNVVIYYDCRVGDRVVLHSGVVLGADGFGFAPNKEGRYEKIPQAGIAVLEDDVEIGANTTIDRATLGETRVGRGTKVDNLVQIAHNVVIGEDTVIAALTGISGSVKIGNRCVIAGQVGISGHVEIADRTTILGQTGIPKSILEPGKVFFGTPAKERRVAYRIEVLTHSLPAMAEELEQLKRRMAEFQKSGRHAPRRTPSAKPKRKNR